MSGDQPAKAIAVFFQYHTDNILVHQNLDTEEIWQDITNRLAEAWEEM